jgi:hypothetical protein
MEGDRVYYGVQRLRIAWSKAAFLKLWSSGSALVVLLDW